MTRTFASLFAAFAVAAASIAPAMADTRANTITVRVSYADLDLTRIEGVKTLTARIEHAAAKACGSSNRKLSLAQASRLKECRVQTINKVIASIDAPLLTALHHRDQAIQFAAR